MGWFYPGEETPCLDLRARVDRRAYLGIYGLDRPDTQQTFGGTMAARRTGFILHTRVWRGARELALDWHDGKLTRGVLRSALGRPCSLRLGDLTARFETQAGDVLEVNESLK